MEMDTICPSCLKRPATQQVKHEKFCGLCCGRARAVQNAAQAWQNLQDAHMTRHAVYRICEVLEGNSLIPKEIYLIGNQEINIVPGDLKTAWRMVGLLGRLLPDPNSWERRAERLEEDEMMMVGRVALTLEGCTWVGRIQIRNIVPRDLEDMVEEFMVEE